MYFQHVFEVRQPFGRRGGDRYQPVAVEQADAGIGSPGCQAAGLLGGDGQNAVDIACGGEHAAHLAQRPQGVGLRSNLFAIESHADGDGGVVGEVLDVFDLVAGKTVFRLIVDEHDAHAVVVDFEHDGGQRDNLLVAGKTTVGESRVVGCIGHDGDATRIQQWMYDRIGADGRLALHVHRVLDPDKVRWIAQQLLAGIMDVEHNGATAEYVPNTANDGLERAIEIGRSHDIGYDAGGVARLVQLVHDAGLIEGRGGVLGESLEGGPALHAEDTGLSVVDVKHSHWFPMSDQGNPLHAADLDVAQQVTGSGADKGVRPGVAHVCHVQPAPFQDFEGGRAGLGFGVEKRLPVFVVNSRGERVIEDEPPAVLVVEPKGGRSGAQAALCFFDDGLHDVVQVGDPGQPVGGAADGVLFLEPARVINGDGGEADKGVD